MTALDTQAGKKKSPTRGKIQAGLRLLPRKKGIRKKGKRLPHI